MKTFTLAVAVAIMLTCISLQESSATSTEEQTVELEEPVSYNNPATEYQQTPVDSWMMPYNRQKRGIRCRFCCGCCLPRVCGLCCRF